MRPYWATVRNREGNARGWAMCHSLDNDEPRLTCEARHAAAALAYSYRVGASGVGGPDPPADGSRLSGKEGRHQRAGTADALAGRRARGVGRDDDGRGQGRSGAPGAGDADPTAARRASGPGTQKPVRQFAAATCSEGRPGGDSPPPARTR